MHVVTVKGILSSGNGINLYRGCSHGCIYCDARSVCYGMDHAFEDIEVKGNALKLLEQALKRKRKPCMIGTGAMSDPYIPLELELCHTRKALELICRYEYGVALQTKSALVLRDLDLLQAINEKTKAVVQMTLTTHDEDLCKILEPNVSSTKVRFETLCRLRDAGIPTVVWICPILPFLNDTEENLRGLLDCCVEARVKGIICFGMGMTLRKGNREYFYRQLDQHFPGLKDVYMRTYGDSYEINSPRHSALMSLFHRICEQNGILHDRGAVFSYLHEYERKECQMSFF